MKVIIVGGVAGGAGAATRLRRMDEQAEIIMFERGEYISYANCGLPYYIGDIIKQRERLIVQTAAGMARRFNIDIRTSTEVTKIDIGKKEVETFALKSGRLGRESYDRLILSPGAAPLRPPIPGIDAANIFTLRSIPDTYAIRDYVDKNKPRRAVVVGGGFIGLEMAENLAQQGITVDVVEKMPQVMAPLDLEMANLVHTHLKRHRIGLHLGDGVTSFDTHNSTVFVNLESGTKLEADLVLLAIGVRPEVKLAKEAGLELGPRGGIKVNQHLQTSHPDIYAVGDAIEVTDMVSGLPALIPLAGPANKQGRIAANHICGIPDTYKATQGTAIVKLLDMTVAATGNSEKQLQQRGVEYLKSYTHSASHAGYYPGATPMAIKLLFTPGDGRILGAQIVGYEGVDKRIDVLAAAMRGRMTVFDLEELELAYAPPFSSAKDPVNMAGYVAANIINGHHPIIHWDELAHLDPGKVVLLDVRTDIERRYRTLPDSAHISLDSLRERLSELPRDKEIIIFCEVGQRGYLAARILMQHGFRVRNLSGGLSTYFTAIQ